MRKRITKISLVFFACMLLAGMAHAQKPVITQQPADVSAYYGNTFTVSIKATGTGVQYQWQSTNDTGAWEDSFGATSTAFTGSVFSFQAVQPKYRCKVSNTSGIVYSREVIVTAICPNMKIVSNPQNTTVQESQAVTFSMTLSNVTQSVVYVEWYVNGVYNSSTQVVGNVAKFTIADVQVQLNGATIQGKVNWTCTDLIHIESTLATLTVATNPMGPKITSQSTSGTAVSGTPATMFVVATGSNLSYQWWARQGNRPDLDSQPYVKVGNGTSSYVFTPVYTNCTEELLDIYCVVSNAYGTPKSVVSTIQILPATPHIIVQPVSLTVKEGASASFTAQASSSQDYTIFNWYKNGVNVFSETKCCGGVATSAYTFSSTAADQDAKVYCEINSYGTWARCSSTSLIVKTNLVYVTVDGGLANGTYKITARHSGKSLTVAGSSTADGADVAQWPYAGTNNQNWTIQNLGGSEYSIRAVNSGKSLDVTANSKSNDADINQWTYSGGANQRWRIETLGGGYYRAVSVRSGKCIDVYQNSKADGVPIHQYTCNGGYNQSFTFVSVTPASTTTARLAGEETSTVTEVATSSATAYPNPSSESFTVKLSGAFTYSLSDNSGNIVEAGDGQDEAITGSEVPSGFYILRVQSASESKVIKVIKN